MSCLRGLLNRTFLFRWRCSLILVVLLSGCASVYPSQLKAITPAAQIQRQIHLDPPVRLLAGTSRVEITPPIGTPLAGYAKRKSKPSTGVRDPLYVRALSLSDGRDQWLILSADLLVFPPWYAERVLNRLVKQTHLPKAAILLSATHTHSGSGGMGRRLYQIAFGRYDPKIADFIEDRILQAADQALKNPQPVGWGVYRDPLALADWIENRAFKDGRIDPSLTVFTAFSSEDRPLAIVVNAAAHPTLRDSKDFQISADFPGVLCRNLEQRYPGTVVLFLNGAAADLRPKDSMGSDGQERAERFGLFLAQQTVDLLSRIQCHALGDVAAWGTTLQLPPPQFRSGRLRLHPWLGRLILPRHKLYLNQLAVGNTVIAAMPAEITAELGQTIQEEMLRQGLTPLVAGYTNGYLGYAGTVQQYEKIAYESAMTWYGAHFGDSVAIETVRLSEFYSELLRDS